jgi:enediyne biosynthesis protein E4
MRSAQKACALPVLLLVCAACSLSPGGARLSTPAPGQSQGPSVGLVPVAVTAVSLGPAERCGSGFVMHALDHVTLAHSDVPHLFESNGAGLAINDLNGDGLLDIVLANLNGPASILWNEGNFTFRKETLPEQDTRDVNIVDVDGDGRLDIVFTHTTSSLSYWRNMGDGRFERQTLPGVRKPAYAMAWGDLRGVGSLDLVTASYDAELARDLGNSFLFGDGAGVFYYTHDGQAFVPQRLAPTAQTLAIALFDFTGNGQPGIVVGNDFQMPDLAWARAQDVWTGATPFTRTTESTMSFDWGDIDNSGSQVLFATDMKPYDRSPRTLAAWMPMMVPLMKNALPQSDPQIMENVLQVRGPDGRFRNEPYERGIDATGWTWSAKFGDLDNDGYLDLYAVNGMIAPELFGYLPNGALVEEHQALRNDGTGHFARAPQWGLGATASGRGMSMADLNNDGRLDIVVNNLGSPAQLFENQLCGGESLEVDLAWPQSFNTHGIGARLVLHTSMGDLDRDVRAASGYLSGDPSRIHFGFAADSMLQRLDIQWPDGAQSSVAGPASHTLLTVTRQ